MKIEVYVYLRKSAQNHRAKVKTKIAMKQGYRALKSKIGLLRPEGQVGTCFLSSGHLA